MHSDSPLVGIVISAFRFSFSLLKLLKVGISPYRYRFSCILKCCFDGILWYFHLQYSLVWVETDSGLLYKTSE